MYTQCKHCKAIFRVKMREVNIAKGKLRCGECMQVFDARKTISTTLPEKFQTKQLFAKKSLTVAEVKTIQALDDWQTTVAPKAPLDKPVKKPNKNILSKSTAEPKKTVKYRKLSVIIVLSLVFLLLAQVLYYKLQLSSNTPKHEPKKIQMLNHNVFVHPTETGILLISASMENTADHAQPYPILELSLSNSQATVISLRRFKPEEYLEDYSSDMLLPKNKAMNLKLQIRDPGNTATHFHFDFL